MTTTPSATPAARKRPAVGPPDLAGLLTPFGVAMQTLNADWQALVAQSPVPGLVASALGALGGRRPDATPRMPPSRSVAKRARADGGSPLPAWLHATPMRSALREAAGHEELEDDDGTEMELASLRPRRLATTPVRDLR